MTDVTASMDLAKILEEEGQLAVKLQAVCNGSGKEEESKLSECTKLFHLMGRLYVKKADVTYGMEQKLNFIKAATLLHGARVRSEIFLKGYMMPEIQESLDEMQTVLMKKCCANQIANLFGISGSIKNTLEKLRSDEKTKLDALGMIGKGMRREEDERVGLISSLMHRNTDNYLKLMKNVASVCSRILGSQPCDFAIASLGSLARDEVTLYSDFEHVIILEEGADDTKDYAGILEYFRWFSVIFHVIVIGIGETIIPSVGVESLNDLYSGEKSKNWFYDSFTPSGISFDGMMPHACKIPIGRQKTTSKKEFVVELIKPVSKMVEYLSNEEDLKNGYCLKDVLCETCLVYGSEKVYSMFDEKAKGILPHEYRRGFGNGGAATDDGRSMATPINVKADDAVQQLPLSAKNAVSYDTKNNANPYVRGHLSTLSETVFDPKTAYYRPLSVLIRYLSRFLRNDGKSGFAKIHFLNPAIVRSPKQRRLLWAFSTACEIRLKSYAKNSGNRVKLSREDAIRYVGEHRCVTCEKTITGLSRYLISLPQNDGLRNNFLGKGVLLPNADVLNFVDLWTTLPWFDDWMMEELEGEPLTSSTGLGQSSIGESFLRNILYPHVGRENTDK